MRSHRSFGAILLPVALAWLGGAALASASEHRVRIAESHIDVVLPDELPARLNQAAVLGWIETSARGLAAYLGRYPVPAVGLRVGVGGRRPVGSGVTFGGPRPSIRIALGQAASPADLQDDWVLTHEMTHLAFPDLTTDDRWAEEGLATYVEPLARIRAGTHTETGMWLELLEGLPKGVPDREDPGLHGTDEWGRTYWGGAMFWLLADIEIRRRSDHRLDLRHALRGILDAGGDIRAKWSLTRTLEAADRALGLEVLADLYRRHGREATAVDLDELWRRLGIRRAARDVAYDPRAPLADIRRRIGSTE